MNIVRKISSLFLVIIIIAFSGGVNIAKHLCEGEVVAKAINLEVNKCKKAESSTLSNELGISEKPCCSTEVSFFKSFGFEKISITKNFALITNQLPTSPLNALLNSTVQKIIYYPPPSVGPPLYIEMERFLI